MTSYLTLTAETIENEHICCAFSDKKCAASYQQKKRWLATQFDPPDARPVFFNDAVWGGRCPVQDGLVAYYSNRCPYAEYHVTDSLAETAEKRGLQLTVIKLETLEQAQACPSPATIFSLFLNGEFVTTDISVCMDSRFDKVVGAV